ncbi:hypothetical protein EV426DRAFT_718954 [Tirmania nivea]|nr:hypothetical protein EV426DRAFT_718954 [Tirmania nivea]
MSGSSSEAAIQALLSSFKNDNIPTYVPGDRAFELSVATPNLLYRFARPRLVVQPETIPHVQAVVKQAVRRKILITIKNGGHSYAGFSSTNTGISLDLSNLLKTERVVLDINSKTATLSGGALWAHAYRELLNQRLDGFVINGGRCPPVGVSGFTLGGGLGPFTRSFGMGVDSLKEVTMVTAKGEVVTVNEGDSPNSKNGKLFWALRGGGGGNFGVVVKLKTNIEKLKRSEVVSGRYTWFPESDMAMETLMTTMKAFYSIKYPNELTIDTSWLCDLQRKAVLGVRYLTYYNGNKSDFDAVIDTCLPKSDLGKQLKRRSMQEKSTRFFHETLIFQWSEESTKSFPAAGKYLYSLYTSFVFTNDQKKMAAIVSIIKKEMEAFRREFSEEKGLLQVTSIHTGGKAEEKQRSDTAFRWRNAIYHAYIMIEWEEKWLQRDMKGFCSKLKKKLRPFSVSQAAAFINFADREMKGKDYEKAYYGNNYSRLQSIKKEWDPDNHFRFAQSIRLPDDAQAKKKLPITGGIARTEPRFMVASFREDSDSGGEQLQEDGGSEEEGSDINDDSTVDDIATAQWENYIPPPPPDGVDFQSFPSYFKF